MCKLIFDDPLRMLFKYLKNVLDILKFCLLNAENILKIGRWCDILKNNNIVMF